MRNRLAVAAAAAVGALGLLAPSAGATTFCVPTSHPACPDNGTNVAEADLDAAMKANATDGIADTVHIAAGTQTNAATFEPAGTDPLTVQGAGPAQTTLTTSSTNNIFVVDLSAGNSRQVTMRDFTVVIPAGMATNQGSAFQVAGDVIENVDIESHNEESSAMASFVGGGTYRGGEIRAEGGGSVGTGIRASHTGSVLVEDVVIRDATTAVTTTAPGAVLTLRRSRIVHPVQSAVGASAGNTDVENTIIETSGIPALYTFANSPNDVDLDADHVTAVDAGGGNSSPIAAQVQVGQTGDADLTISNSIFRGYPWAWQRQAKTGAPEGDAFLTVRYSNLQPASATPGNEADSGDGALTVSEGNIDADPLFAAPDDYRLQEASPSIDAGDPGAGATVDLLGAPRPLDGDANGSAVRDQGAYEFVPPTPNDPDPSDPDPNDPDPDKQAPDTVKGKGPKAKTSKRKASFVFSSEPGATFRCALDSAPPKPCTSPAKLRRLKPGKHSFRVAAIDAAGNADPTPAVWKFKVKRKPRG